MRRDPNLTRLVVTGGVVVMLLGGCTGARDAANDAPALSAAPAPTTSTVATTTTPTTAQSEEQAILAAVQGYWETFLRANDPPNPRNPGIDTYLAGEARDLTLERIANRQQLGQGVRLPANSIFGSHPSVLAIQGDTAVVSDCLVDDSQLIDLSTGNVLSSRLETFRFTMTLTVIEDRWKVVKNITEERWEGQSGCAIGQ